MQQREKIPKNKCWIMAVDNDGFDHMPSLELISRVKKHNKTVSVVDRFKMYRTKEAVQKLCDKANSL